MPKKRRKVRKTTKRKKARKPAKRKKARKSPKRRKKSSGGWTAAKLAKYRRAKKDLIAIVSRGGRVDFN